VVDLSVKIGKVTLKNPFCLEAGPTVRSGEIINEAAEAGWAMVNTKTFGTGEAKLASPICYPLSVGMLNSDLGSEYSWRHWIDYELKVAQKARDLGLKIAANTAPLAPFRGQWNEKIKREVQSRAQELYSAGVDIMSTGAGGGCPVMIASGVPVSYDTHTCDVITALTEATPMPVIVRTQVRSIPFGALKILEMAKSFEKAGASAIGMTDALGPAAAINIETGESELGYPGVGGLSGPAIKPLVLGCIMQLKKELKVPVYATGGVSSGHDAIEMIMGGASFVGACTVGMYDGTPAIKKMLQELEGYMNRKGYNSLDDFRGLALKKFDELSKVKFRRYIYKVDPDQCAGCTQFMNYLDKQLNIGELCSGCGLCVAVCPMNAITMENDMAVAGPKCNNCGICMQVCPITDITYPTPMIPAKDPILGYYIGAYRAKTTDKKILGKAARGGVINALLKYSLENGVIDAAVVTKWGEDWIPSPVIVKDPDELWKYGGTNYIVSPVLKAMRDVGKDKEIKNVAVVCVSCQALALRKLIASNVAPRIANKIRYIIAMPCTQCTHSNLYEVLSKELGFKVSDLVKHDNGTDWKTHAVLSRFRLKDGTVIERKIWETPSSRCALKASNYCSHSECLHGDFVAGGEGNFFPTDLRWSTILTRTPIAEKVWKGAVKAGYIKSHKEPPRLHGDASPEHEGRFKLGVVQKQFQRDVTRCIQVCRWNAVSIKEGKGNIRRAYIDPKKCGGCGLCSFQCPNNAIGTDQVFETFEDYKAFSSTYDRPLKV
jgi:dihydroorotate dehydrogenase (fumarate)